MVRPLPQLSKTESLMLVLNDHPYFFEDDMEHFVLWKLAADAVSEEEIETAVSHLESNGHKSLLRWTFFQNPPSLMSIPEISHAHILVQWQV